MADTQASAPKQHHHHQPYHPLQNEYHREDGKKQEFKKRMAILANTKIDNFIKQHFSDQTQSEMTLFDHLKLKMRGSNIAAQLLVSRIIDGVDWDLDPARCQNKIKQVLPAFGSLMEYCTKQAVLNEHTVRIDLVYNDHASFTKVSKLENAELFYLAIRKLEQMVKDGHARNDQNLLRLNEHFVARAWQRKPIGELKKYVMSGAFIAKQLKDGRKESLDICAKEVAGIVGRYIPSSKVYRLGGLKKKYISDLLIIEAVGILDVAKLNVQHRRICGQLVHFEAFKKEKKEYKTEEQQINELKQTRIKFGKKLNVDCNQRIHQLFDVSFAAQTDDDANNDDANNDDANNDEEAKQQQPNVPRSAKPPNQVREYRPDPDCGKCGMRGHLEHECRTLDYVHSESRQSKKRKYNDSNVDLDDLNSIAKRAKHRRRNCPKRKNGE